ncbi:MAG: NRDE family protein [Planctomycetes bacterium]|nr:NRDE family protein [Planctomycetota bacterium]
MCILIVLRGFHASHPLVLAGNRDERTDRPSSPPGLWVGAQSRMLSPRDRRAGGTWLAVDASGRFAGITNLAAVAPVPDAPSRGHLPHLALDQPTLEAAVAAVRARLATDRHGGFQLVLGDRERTLVLRHGQHGLELVEWRDPVLVVTNEHGPGELVPGGLAPALAPAHDVPRRLDLLTALLRDRGGPGQHAICKHGKDYGTVSSSLIAVPAHDPQQLVWRYAPGPPDVTAYRDYGNLGRRLLPEAP